MDFFGLSILAIVLSVVHCEEEEAKRDKKDISKLQNLGASLTSGQKFGKYGYDSSWGPKYYPSGTYIPPAYNYDYNYERKPYTIIPPCDVRYPSGPSAPFPPQFPLRPSPPVFLPRPIPNAILPPISTGGNAYIPPAPPSFPQSDDTLVIYPSPSIAFSSPQSPVSVSSAVQQPFPKLVPGPLPISFKPAPPRLSYQVVNGFDASAGYNYDKPLIPFKQ